MKRLLLLGLITALFITSFASEKKSSISNTQGLRKASTANEMVLTPTLDGFVRQQQGDFVSNSANAELKKQTGYNREVYLNFDFSNLTINAKTAKLRLFCQSFDKYSEPTLSVYCIPEYQTTGLTWTTRPTLPVATASIAINQFEYTNAWLEWNITPFLATVLATQSKQATIVVVISSGNDALLKLSMSESITNTPSILLTDVEPINGGGVSTSIKMPTIFSDNMVIQRDKPIKVWGEVLSNAPVAITFDGTIYNTQCDVNGKFLTSLPSKSASSAIYSMTIAANNESVSYNNLVMGDVYLCGGQSNMAFKVGTAKADQLADAKADANYPNLRFFEVAKIVNGGVLTGDIDKPWKSAIPERVIDWSAVAFFVGRDLHKHLNIPIGLINVSHGGAPSDAFISPDAYANDPVLNAAKKPDGVGIYSYYQTPSSLYNAMVSKVIGYPIKAVLWYQAEGNAVLWQNYKTIFKGLIKDWRTQTAEPTLPWIFVQLPGFDPTGDPTFMTWAETRDIQLQVWKEDANSAMAVTCDLGEAANIHPTDKYTVAKRLLPCVKALVYGEQLIYKSPVYKSHVVSGNDLIVSFDNIGSGLKSVKEITEFEIAGTDKVYVAATATLLPDNRIQLNSASLTKPLYVRYAFRNFTSVSIYTKDSLSLPLSPFRSEISPQVVFPVVPSTEIPFSNINNAYASSTYSTDRSPIYALNGAGLVNNTTHEANVVSKAWHSIDNPFPHYFKIELKTAKDLTQMRIWNLNWSASYLNRGVKDIEIYVSESTVPIQDLAFSSPQWKKVMNYTMSQANALSTYEGELLNFPTVQLNAKWIGINILNSYNSTNGLTGISEIKLFSPGIVTSELSNFDIKESVVVQNKMVTLKSINEGVVQYSLFTLNGVKVLSGKLNQPPYSFSTDTLPKGCYMLNYNCGGMMKSAKVII